MREALAECGALYNTRELLRRVDGKGVREAARKHRCLLAVAYYAVGVLSTADVEDHELESTVVSESQ